MEFVNTNDVEREWEKVKDKRLFKHYKTQREYSKWRSRFVRLGLITPKPRTTVEHRLRYNREYYARWRHANQEKTKGYTEKHWKKKLGLCNHPACN